MTITSSNPDNLYEYTIVTNGGDPYINSNGLVASKAGSTMVLDINLIRKLSWKNILVYDFSGPAEANSSTVNLPASEEWKTFEYDYAAGMGTVNWGNPGDYMRCDFGNRA